MNRTTTFRLFGLLILTFLLCAIQARATHIMGGATLYKYVGNNRYSVEIVFYRSCNGTTSAAPSSLQFYYKGASNDTKTYGSRSISRPSPVTVVSAVANCTSTQYCAQSYTYRDTITLNGGDTVGYHVYYTNNARNNGILNISTSGNSAYLSWYSFIPTNNFKNNSPRPVKPLVPTICLKKKNIFNPGIYDADGDSLVFSFVVPYSNGTVPNFNKVSYNSGYSLTYPFGTSSPAVVIDSTTGEVYAEPQNTGLYVLAIQVQEYRKDPVKGTVTYLGATRFDLQFVVLNCGSNPAPEFVADTGNYTRTVKVNESFCINVTAKDTTKYSNKYDTLSITAIGSMLDTSINFAKPLATFKDTTGDTVVTADFCWTPSCGHITYSSPHVVTFRVQDQGCNIVEKSYSIYVKPRAFVEPPKIKCVSITGNNSIRVTWDTIPFDSNYAAYVLWRKFASEKYYEIVGLDSNRLSTSILDTAAYAQDSVYQYYLTTANTCGASGATSDTLQSIVITRTALTYGNVEFNWNPLAGKIRDSFVVYADTGAGMQIFDTINVRKYLFQYCSRTIALHVEELQAGVGCISKGNTLNGVFIGDTIPPVMDTIFNVTVGAGNKIKLTAKKNKATDVSHYLIYRSEDGSNFTKTDSIAASAISSTAQKFTYNDNTALPGNKRYWYKVLAIDLCGNTRYYDSIAAPIKLSMTLSNKAVYAAWTTYKGYNVDTMWLQRWDTASKAWNTLKILTSSSGFSNLTYTDLNVSCAPYAYRIKATGKVGTQKQYTYSDSAYVLPFDTIAPAAPELIYTTVNPNVTSNTVKIKPSTSPDVKQYVVYAWKNDVLQAPLDSFTLGASTTSYTYVHTGIRPDQDRYCYSIRAMDSCGNLSPIQKSCEMELQVKAIGTMVNVLNWHPYTGKEIDMYIIEKALASTGSFSNKDTIAATDTTYNDSSVVCNVNYLYRITARQKADQQMVYSDTVRVRTIDTIKPDAPIIRFVTVVNLSTIKGEFYASKAPDVKSYNVYNSRNGGAYQLVTSINSTGATTYQFSQSSINTLKDTNTYLIEAVDSCAANRSINGIPHTALQLSATSGNMASYLSWNAYSGMVIKNYFIERYNRFTSAWDTIATIAGTKTTYTDTTGLDCNFFFNYRVSAVDTSANKFTTQSDTTYTYPTDTVKPSIVNIVSTSVISNSGIEILFDTVPDRDVNRYLIYASENGMPYQLITTRYYPKGKPTGYVHSGLTTLSSKYKYLVFAVDSCSSNRSDTSEIHSPPQLNGTKGNKTSFLNWSPYLGFTVNKYYIQRLDPTNSWEIIDSIPGTDSSYADTKGLACNKTYFYRILAKENTGDFGAAYSDTIGITPFDTVKPAQVNIRYATVVSNSAIEIEFDQVSDADVDQYLIYGKKNGGAWSLLTLKSKPSTSGPIVYQHSGINTLKDIYCYKVTAMDTCASNESATFEEHCAIRQEGYAGNYENYLFWSQYAGFNVKEYVVEYNNGSAWVALATLPPTDSTYVHDTIPCTSKTYRIKAVENGGDKQVAYSNTLSLTPFDTVKPNVPSITNVSIIAKDKIQIDWIKSTSNDVRRYDLYRKYAGGSFVLIKTLGDVNTYTDDVSTSVNTAYCYAIKAVDSCANNASAFSSEHCNIYLAADTNKCEYAIYLDWSAYSGWPVVSKYNIYRTETGKSETLLTSVTGGQLQYKDLAIKIGTEYCYRIEAIPGSGSNTSFSASSCGKTYTPEKPEILSVSKITTSNTAGDIVVKWKSVQSQRFYSYHRLYYRPVGGSFSLVQDNIPVNKDSFVHSSLDTRNKDYQYYLVTVDSCGNNNNLPSDQHKSMNLTGAVGQLIHKLNWTSYKGWPVDKYIVERLEGGVFKQIITLTGSDTASTIIPAPCNYNIIYRIKATDTKGNFAYSDTISKQAIDTIPPNAARIRNLSVTGGLSTRLDFRGADSADVYKYVIQRARNGAWLTAGEILYTTPGASHTYNDVINTLTDQFCYTIITLDSCLNATMTDTFCAIQLRGKELNQANRLDWFKFKGYPLDNYYVLQYRNNKWDTLSILSPTDTALVHDSLHCYLPYNYKIMGVQNGGYTTFSDSIQLTPFDTIIPPPSAIKYATVQDDHSVKVEWKYNTRSDVKYFEVWRSINNAPAQKIATQAFDSIYIDKNVDPQRDTLSYYIITIDSCNSAHRSLPSDVDRLSNIKVATGACVPEIRVNWTAYASLPAGTDEFVLHRKDGNGAWASLKTLSNTTLSYIDHAVSEGTSYCYRIQAVDKTSGYSSFSDSFCISPWVFPRPDTSRMEYISVVKTGVAGEIYMQWKRVDPNDTFAKAYRLYYYDAATSKYIKIYETKDLDITNFTLGNINTEGEQHRFYLATTNRCDVESEPGRIHSAVNISILNEQEKATISWTTYLGMDMISYNLYRAMDGKTPVKIGTHLPGDTMYVDTNLRCGHYYTYQIKTSLQNGHTSLSDTAGIRAIDNIPPPGADLYAVSVDTTASNRGNISISFFGNNDKNRSGYNIYRSVNGGPYNFYIMVPDKKTGTLYWQDKGVNTDKNIYSYYLRALDTCGNVAPVIDTHTVVQSKAEAFSKYIKVDWTPYNGWDNWQYLLEKQVEDDEWQIIDTFDIGTFTYNDSNVTCHVLYRYRIRSIDGNSSWISFSNVSSDTGMETEAPEIAQIRKASVVKTDLATGTLRLEWNSSASRDTRQYHISRSTDGTSWTHLGSTADTTLLDTGINTYRQAYYYRVQPEDSCGNMGIGYSILHRSMQLRAQAGNQEVKLSWNSYQGWTIKGYAIIRNGKAIDTIPATATGYSDTAVLCGRMYQYEVAAVCDSMPALLAYSNSDSASPQDTKVPERVYIKTASVYLPNDVVYLEWLPSTSFDVHKYYIYRRQNADGVLTLIDSTSSTIYYDSLANTDADVCYVVYVRDMCGNLSYESNKACIVKLAGTNKAGINTLSWNDYKQWKGGIKGYNLYRSADGGAWEKIGYTEGPDNAFIDFTTANDVLQNCYQVEAIEDAGSQDATSRSTVFCLNQNPIVFVPTAFSPQATFDMNDRFGPKGTFVKDYSMKIMNRWGEVVFESAPDNRDWDGTVKGKLAPEGVYIYQIVVKGFNDGNMRLSGNVTLIR